MIYQRLADIFGEAEDAHEGARAALMAMRDAGTEVAAAGIDADRWRAAIEQLLASADAADAVRAEESVARQRTRWSKIRRQLEQLGCRVWQSAENKNLWYVEAPGIELEVDLDTGDVENLWIGPLKDPIGELPRLVQSELEHRRVRLAAEARRDALRKTHTWSNNQKAWLPKDGNGPPIKGGG